MGTWGLCWHPTSGTTRRDTLGMRQIIKSAEGSSRSTASQTFFFVLFVVFFFVCFMELSNIPISRVIRRHMTCGKQPGPAGPSGGMRPSGPSPLRPTPPEDDICGPEQPLPTSQHRADCKCYRGCQVESIFVSDIGLPLLNKQCNAEKPNSGPPC